MNNRRNKEDNILQLKQTIIFLKSELAKYQNEVKQLQKDDYYSLSLKLDEENFQLKQQEKQLSLELLKLQREFEKEVEKLQKGLQEQKEKKAKLIHSIEALVTEKNNLRTENAQLVQTLQQMQQTVAPPPSLTPDVEQLFLDFIEKTNQQFRTLDHTLDEKLKRSQFEAINNIIEKIQHESNDIKQLLHTMKETGLWIASANNQENKNAHLLSHLDQQLYKVYSKTLDFEQQLEKKTLLLNKVEQQLIQLKDDIEEK